MRRSALLQTDILGFCRSRLASVGGKSYPVCLAPEPDSTWTCRSQQQVRLRRCSQTCASGALLRAATMLPCGPICSYQEAFPWARALLPSAWPTKEQEQAPVRLSSLRQIQIYIPSPPCFGSLYMQLVWRQTLPLGRQACISSNIIRNRTGEQSALRRWCNHITFTGQFCSHKTLQSM